MSFELAKVSGVRMQVPASEKGIHRVGRITDDAHPRASAETHVFCKAMSSWQKRPPAPFCKAVMLAMRIPAAAHGKSIERSEGGIENLFCALTAHAVCHVLR